MDLNFKMFVIREQYLFRRRVRQALLNHPNLVVRHFLYSTPTRPMKFRWSTISTQQRRE